MRTVTTALLGVALGALLAGCSQVEPQPTAAPTPSVNAAESSCNDFSDHTDRVADLVISLWTDDVIAQSDEDELEGAGAKFDTLALKAEGTVGERMASVAEVVLAESPIVMSLKPDDYFASIEAVQRACAAEGVEIGVATWK